MLQLTNSPPPLPSPPPKAAETAGAGVLCNKIKVFEIDKIFRNNKETVIRINKIFRNNKETVTKISYIKKSY